MLKKIFKILVILIPLAILSILIIDILSFYSNISVTLISYLREIVIFSLIFLCYQFIKSRLNLDELTISQNLRRITYLIAINFFISIILKLLLNPEYSSSFPAKYNSLSAVFVSTVMAFTASFTLVPALFLLKQLIFYKRKRNTSLIFHAYLLVITINAFSVYFSRQPVGWLRFSNQSLANDISFSVALILVIMLSFRNEWITYLSRKKKIIYFFSGIPTFIAIVALFDIVYRQSLPSYSLTIAALTFNMWIFLLIYGGLAISKLFLQLPTARAFDRKIKELNSLYDLGRLLNSETNINKLLPLITRLTSQVLESHSTWLELYEEKEHRFTVVSQINLTLEEIKNNPFLTNDGLNELIIKNKDSILINDIPHHRQFKNLLQWKKEVRTILGAPLFSNRGQLMGIIYATKAKEYTFDIDDVSLLQGVSNQAAAAIENARLLKQSIERERLEQELKIARDVQLKLLPQSLPKVENFDIDAFCLSAYELGGDYYDFFYFSDGNPGIIVGDVSGKGTSAALYMAEFKGIIQTLAKNHKNPYTLACDINRIIYPNIERRSFVSAIIAKLNSQEETVVFTRAGHTPVLYCSGNSHEPSNIITKGIGIGLDPGSKFNEILEEYTVSLKENGTVIFYTDGLTEARNGEGLEFGEERLLLLFKDCKRNSAFEIKEKLVKTVVEFCAETPLHDDLTFVILKNCNENFTSKP
ncbi:MAG: hypothetical protein A2Y94_02740 [Caldithrix sp. RBG_13_44_9]|nr:MAG: hypothetical protein A2Y94_02740 [Caldithrix sp. RBG_13_44_9]